MGCKGGGASKPCSFCYRCEDSDMKEQFACLKCRKSECPTLKVLPCLHLYCLECLENLIAANSIAMPKNDEGITCSIFSCSLCGYVVRVVNDDITFLKSFNFYGVSDDNPSDDCANAINETPIRNCCENSTLEDLQLYCATCASFVCADCLAQSKHDQHDFSSDDATLENKRLNLQKFCLKMGQRKGLLLNELHIIDNICSSLKSNKEDVKAVILKRHEKVIEKINDHKINLLSQLESSYLSHCAEQMVFKDNILKDINNISECLKFCQRMLKVTQKKNLLNIYGEMSAHASRILSQKTVTSDIMQQVMLEEIDLPKEDLLVEKLLGSLIIGSIMRSSPHLANVYHTNLSWPCGLATNSKEFMLAGKIETFGGTGKLFFSDKDMKSVKYIDLPENCLPLDLLHLPDDSLLLSTNDGCISKYSFQGVLLEKWTKMFEGTTGRLAHFDQEHFMVTSVEGHLFIFSIEEGKLSGQLTLAIDSPVRSMTTRNKQIFCILENNKLNHFDLGRLPLQSDFDFQHFNSVLKCPSSLVCDPFGNVLVSDFTSDCIYFFDQKGQCLGPILSKESDSIRCPNKIILDSCGNLYVSQYGGDVLVFDYLSCAKKI